MLIILACRLCLVSTFLIILFSYEDDSGGDSDDGVILHLPMETDVGVHVWVLRAALQVLLGHGCEDRERRRSWWRRGEPEADCHKSSDAGLPDQGVKQLGRLVASDRQGCEADGLPVGGKSGGDNQGVKQIGRLVLRTDWPSAFGGRR